MSATAIAAETAPLRSGATYRPDLEGLRAVAILAVVFFHSGVPFVTSGYVGVDVFLVISGFLITGIVAGVLRKPTGPSIGAVVLRRLGRLVPAATLLMLSVALTAWVLLPALDRLPLGEDIVAVSLARMNLRLQQTSTDYLNSDATPSLLQHFWSLSVEWQFYGVCLAVLLIAAVLLFLSRRVTGQASGLDTVSGTPAAATTLALGVLSIGTLASFAWNVTYTYAEPALSYLAVWTRLWEFGLGGLCWVALRRWVPRMTRGAAGLLSLLGLISIVVASIVIGTQQPFPGWIALMPTLGTAAIIVCGTVPNPVNAGLGHPIAAYVGARSYAWYLWHWPPLILFTMLLFEPSWPLGLVISGGTFLISVVTYRLFERPLRRWSRTGNHRAVATAMSAMVVATVVIGLLLGTTARNEQDGAGIVVASSEGDGAGSAGVRSKATRVPDVAPARNPIQAEASLPRIYADGCHADVSTTTVGACRYGDPEGTTEVVLLGDSHAAQWFPALEAAAVQQHWQLRSLTKSSCPGLTLPQFWLPTLKREYRECDQWTRNALASVRADKPDLVIMATRGGYQVSDGAGSPLTPDASGALVRASLARTATQLREGGIRVAVMESTAVASGSVPPCLARKSVEQCAIPFGSMLSVDDYLAEVAAALGLPRIFVRDLQCPLDPCPTTRDGVIVMRDAQHLTAEFSQRLADPLVRRLRSALGSLLR